MSTIRVSSVLSKSSNTFEANDAFEANTGDPILVKVHEGCYRLGVIKLIKSRESAIVRFDDNATLLEEEFPASALTLIKE